MSEPMLFINLWLGTWGGKEHRFLPIRLGLAREVSRPQPLASLGAREVNRADPNQQPRNLKGHVRHPHLWAQHLHLPKPKDLPKLLNLMNMNRSPTHPGRNQQRKQASWRIPHSRTQRMKRNFVPRRILMGSRGRGRRRRKLMTPTWRKTLRKTADHTSA